MKRLLLVALMVAAKLAGSYGATHKSAARLQSTEPINTGSAAPRLRGLYMGWVGMANLGDELVLDIFGHLLRDTLMQPGLFQRASLEYQHPGVHHTPMNTSDASSYDFAVLGGGSLLETSGNPRTRPCNAVRDVRLPLFVHGTGTQLSYDGREYDHRNLRCVAPPGVWGGVRGPLTQALIGNMSAHFNANLTGGELPVLGDSGILADRIFPRVSWGVVSRLDTLARSVEAASAATYADSGGLHRRDPVLCVSGAVQAGRPGSPGFRNTSSLVEEWAKEFIVVLLPVDPLTAQQQAIMLDAALRSGRVGSGRLMINMHIGHYGVWLAALGRCDLLITVRLHAAVMAAAAATPFVIPYDGDEAPIKVRDFLLGTVGEKVSVGDFLVRQSEFDGSVGAVAEMLRVARANAAHHNAAFNAAVTAAYASYMSSLRAFVDAMLPGSLRSLSEVSIQMARQQHGAVLDLTFR